MRMIFLPGFLPWFASGISSDTVDTPLRLITEGQPHEDEAPSPLRWDFAQLQVHGTARLAHPHMISSSSIGQHKSGTTLQDLPGGEKKKENCSLTRRKYQSFSFIKPSKELASSSLTADVLYFLCRQQHEADLYRHTVSPLSWATESEHPWVFVQPHRDLILWWENESAPGPWGGLQGFNRKGTQFEHAGC